MLTKRELRTKAAAEGKALFAITIDERPRGGVCIEYSGIADEELITELRRVINENIGGKAEEG